MTLPFSLEPFLQQYDHPSVRAFVLMGSYARGDAGPFSDVDLVRFVNDETEHEADTHLVEGTLLVVSTVPPAKVDSWFYEPDAAVETITGVRQAQPILDRDGTFATIQARAHAFTWDAAMQARADRWASKMMVGLIEEAHKGLEGLRRGHPGRLLNARFGLSWLLSRTVQVQRGVLSSGDNGFYDEVAQAVGPDSRWVHLRRTAFGIEDDSGHPPSLKAQVRAGLALYVETARLLYTHLTPDAEPLIAETATRIENQLNDR